MSDKAGLAIPPPRQNQVTDCSGEPSLLPLTHTIIPRESAGHCGRLGCLRGLGGGGLLLHLLEALPQVEHLGVRQRVDLVHRVPGRPASLPGTCQMSQVSWYTRLLPVKVVGLDKHGVVTETPDPDIALPHQVQLDPLPDVQPGLVTRLSCH